MLFELASDVVAGMNERKPASRTVVVALDLSKAFDLVDHSILLHDLAASATPAWTVRWLASYLRGRQTRVLFRGEQSRARVMRRGVPQGSVLSPALFNHTPVKMVSYADDLSIYCQAPQPHTAAQLLNDYMPTIADYLTARQLIISVAKSTVSLFTLDPKKGQLPPECAIQRDPPAALPPPKAAWRHL